ncbi:MAG: heavy metal translocating P-type ATPase [Bacillus sp. (in: firmicutes)]
MHSIPGRVRLKLVSLNLGNAEIESKFRMLPGIISVNYSEISGNVVLYHKYKYFTEELLTFIDFFFQADVKIVKKSVPVRQVNVRHYLLDLSIVMGAFIIEKMFKVPVIPVAQLAFLTPTAVATLVVSRDIIKNGLSSILKPNPDTLTTAALVASLLKGNPKSAMVIYIMSSISELLTEVTMSRTRGFVREMMSIDTPYAWLITEQGKEVKVSVNQVKVGDRVIVFQGDKIPFDGKVVAHYGQVDQSSITGEYMPTCVSEGSYVYGGSIMTEGKITIEVDRIGDDLAVNRMIKLIEEAQEKQAPVQLMTERFTEKVVPLSFILAAGIYMLTKDWNRVLNMLVIDYVCGVKLSTATAISASIGKAAKKGVLLKGGQTLEALAKVDTVVLDKTGTITEGLPMVKDVIALNGYTEEEVLAYAASAEEHSNHPIAEAIISEAHFRSLSIPEHHDESIENFVGKGVTVDIHNEKVIVGSKGFMQDQGIIIDAGIKTGIFVAKQHRLMGIINIEDKIRYGMNRSINQLRRMGVDEVIMLTGDYEESAQKVAHSTNIDHYIAEAMPQEKSSFVRQFKQERDCTIMMVGDGINDAPALAYANIGVTMGAKKTDIAMETADVVIYSDNPLLLSEAVKLSKQTMKTIKQNIFVTVAVNTGAIALGTIGAIQPIAGAAIHNAATIAVVLNSLKLLLSGGRKDEFQIQNHSLNSRKNQIEYSRPRQYERV